MASLADVFRVLNKMREEKVVAEYAVGGATAVLFYAEPTRTYDVDVFVTRRDSEAPLVSLAPVYRWAEGQGFALEAEHLMVHGVPVQILPSYNALVAEDAGRPELAPLRVWATAINHLYEAIRISPDAGATLARTLEMAGYRRVRANWMECPSDALTIENMLMFYDEVRDRLESLGILSVAEVAEQQRLLRALPPNGLPGIWGIHRVAADA